MGTRARSPLSRTARDWKLLTAELFSPLGIKGLLCVTSNYTCLVLDLRSNDKI